MNRVELKEKAKASLQGKYGDAILVVIILGIIGGITGQLSYHANQNELYTLGFSIDIISLIVDALFAFGSLSFFLKISRDEEVTYQELFSKTNMFIPYILITLITGIFILLWSLLFIIPGIIAAFSYSLVYYIALDNPEMDTMDVLRKSKELMYGHKLDFFVLQLSFIGWMILGAFTCGILYLWLIPYMSVTNANFYNSLIEE